MLADRMSRRSVLRGAAVCGAAALGWAGAARAESSEAFVKQDLTALFDTPQGTATIAAFASLVGASAVAGLGRYVSDQAPPGTLTAMDVAMLSLAAETAEPKLQAALQTAFTRARLTDTQQALITTFWSGVSADNVFAQSLLNAAGYIALPANFQTFQDFATAAPVTQIQQQADIPVTFKTAPNVAALDALVAAIRVVGTTPDYVGLANLIFGVTRQAGYARALLEISPLACTALVPYQSLPGARPAAARPAASPLYQCRIAVGAGVALTVIVAGLAAAAIAAGAKRPEIPLLQVVLAVLGAGATVGVSEQAMLAAIFPDCDDDLDNVLTQADSGEPGDNECKENGCNGSPPTMQDRLHSLIERAEAEKAWRAAGRKVDMFHLPRYPRLPDVAVSAP
jgi:hypothetical protein